MVSKRSQRIKLITNEALKFDPNRPINKQELLEIAIQHGKTNDFMDVDKTTLKKDIEVVMIRQGLKDE
tara:strand:- start:3894 stop:4097 length:204 start_codon:yes stop_codon:yes gene_type:complete